jgi:hypothetical protein
MNGQNAALWKADRMKNAVTGILILLATGIATGPAAAQAPSGLSPAAASGAAAEAFEAAEDLAILKAVTSLQLTRAQLAELLPVLRGAQARLTELDTKLTEKLAAHRTPLEQARQDLLAGKSSGARAEQQYALALAAAQQQRAGLRADLVANLRRHLGKTLSAQQQQQLVQCGQIALITARMATPGGGRGPFGPGPGAGGPGRVSTGETRRGNRQGLERQGDGATRQRGSAEGGGRGMFGGGLDRIRGMSDAEFQESMQSRAERFGGMNSPQFQQYLSLMNQVRSMPDSQFALQREQLMVQMMAMGRGAAIGGPGGNEEEAANAFVDRYLLSPRAPIVLDERLRAR